VKRLPTAAVGVAAIEEEPQRSRGKTDVSSGSTSGSHDGRSLRVGAVLAAIVLASGALTGCGGSSKRSSSNSPAEQVKQAWTTFFNGSTPAATKVALLQNGQRFAPIIQAEANSPLARQTKVVVKRVTLLGRTRASVLYTIELGGQPALPNQTGTAVLAGGRWQVSDRSFCSLLSLQGAVPPACRGV
jgi:hypothetical protein